MKVTILLIVFVSFACFGILDGASASEQFKAIESSKKNSNFPGKEAALSYFKSEKEFERNRVSILYNRELPIVAGQDYYRVKESEDLEQKADSLLFLRSCSSDDLKRAVGCYQKALDKSSGFLVGNRLALRWKLIYALILADRESEARLECKKLTREEKLRKRSNKSLFFGAENNTKSGVSSE